MPNSANLPKIVVTRIDGGISILSPGDTATPESMERDAINSEGYLSHRQLNDNEIPNDRVFRNAWVDNNGINYDINKCRQLIRERRNFVLEELDKKAFSESRKPNGNVSPINNEAQRLRDIPQQANFNSDDVLTLKQIFLSI